MLAPADACRAVALAGPRLYLPRLSRNVKGCNYVVAPRRAGVAGPRGGPARAQRGGGGGGRPPGGGPPGPRGGGRPGPGGGGARGPAPGGAPPSSPPPPPGGRAGGSGGRGRRRAGRRRGLVERVPQRDRAGCVLDPERGRVAALPPVVGEVAGLGQDLPVLVEHDVDVDPSRRVAEEVDVAPLDHEPPVRRGAERLGPDARRRVHEQVVPERVDRPFGRAVAGIAAFVNAVLLVARNSTMAVGADARRVVRLP